MTRHFPKDSLTGLDPAMDDAEAFVRHADDPDNYDPDCPACLRARPHTDPEHLAAIERATRVED